MTKRGWTVGSGDSPVFTSPVLGLLVTSNLGVAAVWILGPELRSCAAHTLSKELSLQAS